MPKGIYLYPKSKEQIREQIQKQIETKRKTGNWGGFQKGHKDFLSREMRIEIRKKLKGRMPKNIVAGWNKGKSKANGDILSYGRPRSEETRKKISEALKGKKLSEEHRKKISERNKLKIGELAFNWKDGRTKDINKWNLQKKEEKAGRKRPEQCEICGAFGKDSRFGIVFDHDHKTEKFRGWVCTRCNLVMGMVKDDTELLIAIVDYLRKSQ